MEKHAISLNWFLIKGQQQDPFQFSLLQMIWQCWGATLYYRFTAVQSTHSICKNRLAPLLRPALPAEAILRFPDGPALLEKFIWEYHGDKSQK